MQITRVAIVRNLTDRDLVAINRLMRQVSSSTRPVTSGDLRLLVQHSYLFIARDDAGAIVGMATFSIHHKMVRKEAWVDDVVVDESARGQGIAQALMDEVIAVARRGGADRVLLTCRPSREAANRLYLRLGFQLYETNVHRMILTPPQ